MPYATLAIHQLAVLTTPAPHTAAAQPLTIDQAHTDMEFHAACLARQCPRKADALQAPIAAEHVVLSADKPRDP
jgi:hypothetical protein